MSDASGKRPILAAVADLHCGSVVGLCPPELVLQSGGVATLNGPQGALWQGWLEFWRAAGRLRQGRPLIVLALGDLVDGPRGAVWSANLVDQEDAAVAALSQARTLSGGWDALYVLRGTAWHVGEGACPEERIGRRLEAERDGAGRFSCYRLWLDAAGVLIEAAHRAWGAYRPWTRGAVAARMATAMLAVCAEEGWPIPRLMLRAHTHNVSDSGNTLKNIRCIVLPAWQLTTEFAHGRGAIRPADVGGLVADLETMDARIIRAVEVEQEIRQWRQ